MHDLSPWGMFLNASFFVKAVMITLALASLAAWTVFFAKSFEIFRARNRLVAALSRIDGCLGVQDAAARLADGGGVLGRLLAAAAKERHLSERAQAHDDVHARATTRFAEIFREESASRRHGVGVLATIGAIGPFVGLLGTVWGVMNSFIGISEAQTTNLAVVAPGIAEALLATAIGLVAAIPAVVFYNAASKAIRGYLDVVQRASGAAGRLLSRDLDRRAAEA